LPQPDFSLSNSKTPAYLPASYSLFFPTGFSLARFSKSRRTDWVFAHCFCYFV
jgi:hypothetical protein